MSWTAASIAAAYGSTPESWSISPNKPARSLADSRRRCGRHEESGWSQIDVQLKRRHDLIPNLVESVKGYAGHEKETLENVTRARSQAVSAQGAAERRHSRALR